MLKKNPTAFRRWEVRRRPADKPSAGLLFGVRDAGYYRTVPGFQSGIFTTHFIQVFWCEAGEGMIVINGRERFLRSGQVALYFPEMHHCYYSNKNWNVYWWTMDGPLVVSIVAAFGLKADVYTVGPPPVRLFHALGRALQDPTPYGEAQAASIAFQLLVKARFAYGDINKQGDTEIAGIVDHINANWNKPTLNVKNLAATIGLNRTSLSRRFHKALGIPPGEYIARLRTQNASLQLINTNKQIKDIAMACGYLDGHYFARIFKQRFGDSPKQMRKKNPLFIR